MSIKGKTEGVSRLVGSILIFISIVLEMSLSFLILNNPLLILSIILFTAPPFILSVLLKLEQNFMVKNTTKFLPLVLLEIIVVYIVIFAFFRVDLTIKFYLVSCSNLLLIICWHTSLSLYKNKKIIFFLSSAGYFIINTLIWLNNIVYPYLYTTNLILKLTVLLGIFLITSSELIMKKKGWLKYL
ncbi:MAG: hypothetical protein KGD70_04820 [Candidatus Lokiarchaeota archaeon]|nr:hypothetical protein [Candidatus Lokiarchaeota archaeon]